MITRRTFLKGVGASAAGAATLHLLGQSVFASGEMPPDQGGGQGGQTGEQFVYAPYWGPEAVKTAVGGEILFFGDVHDLEDNYFYYDPASGETRGVFTYLKSFSKRPGLYASIGDYLQASSDITSGADPYYKCIDRIRAWGGEDAPIVSVMGNHEYKTPAQDDLNPGQVFEKVVGNNTYGLIARGVDAADPEKVLYYVVGLGCAHTQEVDAAGQRAGAKNKYWVNPDAIAILDEALAEIYGEDNSKNQGVPTFIDAHIPVHYYTDERSAENNCELLRVLNKYPYVVYIWGHNHSEKDPCYGTVRLPGNTIVPNASLDEVNAAGEPAAQEIRFTYVACGAVRGNQISDNEEESSERALYVTVDGSRLSFEYCGRDGEIFDRGKYAVREATYFERFDTWAAKSAAGLTVDLQRETEEDVVRRADFFLARPVPRETPGPVTSFSQRYAAEIQWLDENGSEVEGAFDFGRAYTARITLTSDTARFELPVGDVYLFDTKAVAIPARCIARREVLIGEGRAVIEIGFTPTAALADTPLAPVGAPEPGRRYVIAADREQYLFTCARADCFLEDGQLLTVPDTAAYWEFEERGEGLVMRSANGKYLTSGKNGPNIVLVPTDAPEDGAYYQWVPADGALTIDMDGTIYTLACPGGAFKLVTNPGDAACRLYEIPA